MAAVHLVRRPCPFFPTLIAIVQPTGVVSQYTVGCTSMHMVRGPFCAEAGGCGISGAWFASVGALLGQRERLRGGESRGTPYATGKGVG